MKKLYTLQILFVALAISATQLKAQYTADSLFADLQNELDTRRSAYNLPGASVSIILRDGTTWTGTSGNQCTGTVDSLKQWHWGSVSKATTATIIMQMRDQGLLSLTDTLGTYFNTGPYPNIDGTNTIKDLLQHTSNLDDPWSNSTAFQNLVSNNACSVLNQQSGFPFVGTPTPNPNKEHRYTPYINYALLSSIIENISGNTLKQEYQNRIFTPLGMSNSTIVDSVFNNANINGMFVNGSPRCSQCHTANLTRGGGGALLSSIQDIAKFMNYLHSDSILSDTTMMEMRTTIDANITGPIPCGGNVYVEYGLGVLQPNLVFAAGDTMKLYGHSGSGRSTGSVFTNIDSGWTVAIASNDYGNVGNQLTNAMIFNILCLLHNNPVDFSPAIPAPTANFVYSANGNVVTFTDSTTNNPDTWDWDFGDGNTDTVQNPVHTYGADGTYTVRLIAGNSGGVDTFETTLSVVSGLDNSQFEGLTISPNPFSNQVTFKFGEETNADIQISIYDVQGSLINELEIKQGNSSFIWQPENLKKGFYLYKIISDDKMSQGKLIYE